MTRFYKICLLAFLFFPFHSMASHGTGGEISWECQGNGQYIFRLNFYRDCAGIAAPNSVSLTTTVPGVTFISLQKIAQFSITNNGYLSDGVQTCAQCASAVPGSLGLHEKVIYESLPVTLPGLPADVVGWQFYWGECCRSNFTNNISNPGSVGFRYRAVMYRTAGHQPGQCFDSSPVFAEIPQYNFCTGYAQSFSCMAIDPEGDSLTYAWAQPYDDNGANAQWSPGYSLNSQLPSATQNPLNEPAVLNSFSGQVDLKSFTGGLFAVCTKATSYRDGYKSAEIFRELSIVLNNSCAPILGGAQNLPPVINAPFIDPVTGLNTSWNTTVFAGDTVSFDINYSDIQFFNNGLSQNISITAHSDQFGSGFTNPSSGCLDPPCATVFPALPSNVPVSGQFSFNWVTDPVHSSYNSLNCIHYFSFTICDNYCPANACVTKTAAIRVLSRMPLNPPVLRCASVNQNGDVTLNWSPTTSVDSFGYFQSYRIYASTGINGPYQVVDSVVGNINASSFIQTAASIQNYFGVSALNQPVYYRVSTLSLPIGGGESFLSNRVANLNLSAINHSSGFVSLSWNAPSSPVLTSHNGRYFIYREYPVGNWILIDSTFTTGYFDAPITSSCTDSLTYKIELLDTTGCVLLSKLSGIRLIGPSPTIAGGPTSICQGQSLVLNAGTGFTSYNWSTGANSQNITVTQQGIYTCTVTNSAGCTGTASINVTVNPNPTPVINSSPYPNVGGNVFFCFGNTTTLNAGGPYAAYIWSNGSTSQSINISNSVPITVTVTDINGCTGAAAVSVVENPNVTPNITGSPIPATNGSVTFCQGLFTNLNAGAGYPSYLWNNGSITQTIQVQNSGVYAVTITDPSGCTGTSSVNVIVNPIPNPAITGNTVICQGQTTVLTASAGYTNYQWSTGQAFPQIAVTNGNTYTITVTDANGCSGSASVTVTVNPLPGIGIAAVGSTSFCQGDSVRLEAMGVGAAYLWHRNNNMVTPINATMVHYAKTKGSYYCVISDFNGCTNSSNIIYVDVPCVPIDPAQQRDPVSDDDDQAGLVVFPNPSYDEFTVMAGSTLSVQPEFTVTDLTGRAVNFHWRKADHNTWKIAIPHPGFYFVKHQNQIIRLLKLE